MPSVADLTRKVEARETSILENQADADYKRTIAHLEIERNDATKQWSTAEKTCEDLAARIQALKTELAQLEARKQETKNIPADLVPKQK